MLRAYIKHPVSGVENEYAARLRPDKKFEVGTKAFDGEADVGNFILDDPLGTLDWLVEFAGRRRVRLTEDASGSEKTIIVGRIASKEFDRGTFRAGRGRELNISVEDANADLSGIIVHGFSRPAETGYARVLATLTTYLNGTASTALNPELTTYGRASTVIGSAYVQNAGNLTMPAETYDATDPLAVIRACAEFEDKRMGVYIEDDGTLNLYYAPRLETSQLNSTISISDNSAVQDRNTVFAPNFIAGPAFHSDTDETITGMLLIHPDGLTFERRGAAEAIRDRWEEAVFTDKPVASGVTQIGSMLDARDDEQPRRQFAIRLPASKVHLVKSCMRMEVKRAVVSAVDSSTYFRIVNVRYGYLSPDEDENQYNVIVTLETPVKIGAHFGAGTPSNFAPTCGTPYPYAFALGVDGAGWTKTNDPDSPPAPAVPQFRSANVSASGDHALLTNVLYGNFNFPPFGFHDWYAGGKVTYDDYAPAAAEEMLFRFKILVLGDDWSPDTGEHHLRFITTAGGGGAVVVLQISPSTDGSVAAAGGGSTTFSFTQGVSYYLRWKLGDVYLWEVGDTEPVSPTASGGIYAGAGALSFELNGAADDPSQFEIESVTHYQVIDDPNCLTDPGDSPYVAHSDDPRFDTIVTDHGGLSGLADDDHTQYIKDAEFTAKGDLLAGTGSGTFDNLPAGTNGYVLKANSATTTGLEWATETGGGGSGPFEDAGGGPTIWNLISGATNLQSTDGSTDIELDTDQLILSNFTDGSEVRLENGKASITSPFGVVVPIASTDPAGGDSEDGQVYYNNTSLRFRAYQNGVWVDAVRGALTSRTSAVAIANTETVVTNFSMPGAAPFGFMEAGTTFRIKAFGRLTSGGTGGSSIFRCRIGTTTLTGNIPATLTIVNANSVTNAPFQVEMLVTVRTDGSGGTAIGNVEVKGGVTAAFTSAGDVSATSATVVVDTTATKLIELTYLSGNAGTTATFENATIELLA